jgi:hypothetical protein
MCGPFPIKSLASLSYFMTFVDEESQKLGVYLWRKKSETLNKFLLFKYEVEYQR